MQQNFKVTTTSGFFIPDCLSDVGRMEIAIKHSITLSKFDYYKSKQSGGPLPGTRFTLQDIHDKMNTPVSGVLPDYFKLQWDEDTNDITIVPQTGQYPIEIDYSVCLFKGIEILDALTNATDYYVFFKAKDLQGTDTIVFMSVQEAGDVVRNYYDLSNDRP